MQPSSVDRCDTVAYNEVCKLCNKAWHQLQYESLHRTNRSVGAINLPACGAAGLSYLVWRARYALSATGLSQACWICLIPSIGSVLGVRDFQDDSANMIIGSTVLCNVSGREAFRKESIAAAEARKAEGWGCQHARASHAESAHLNRQIYVSIGSHGYYYFCYYVYSNLRYIWDIYIYIYRNIYNTNISTLPKQKQRKAI